MDQSTKIIRRNSWMEIIRQCQSRPDGITAKDWMYQNGISEKSYYYWLRKFRKEAFEKLPPAVKEQNSTELAFAEIQLPVPVQPKPASDEHHDVDSVAVIRCNGITLEVSNNISESLLHKLIMEVSHA